MIDGAEVGLSGVLYVAGRHAPPGRYRRITGAPREVEIPDGGRLPASFDGQVALYARMPDPVSVDTPRN